MCIRVPPAISKRSRIWSRSSKQYQNSEIAPSSSADVPSQTRCEWMRFSSASAIRAHDRAARHLDAEELLDREDVEELVRVERDVVDARRVRHRLPPRLVLHVLLEAGVEVADDRADARDRLAVEVDDEAEHAVRRGMVRPEVDAEDVLEPVLLGVDLEDRRHGLRDARPLVDARGREDRHQSSSEKRTGSPPSG